MKTCERVTSHTAFCPGPQLAKCSPPKGFSRENSMEILMGGGATWAHHRGRALCPRYIHTQQNIHNLKHDHYLLAALLALNVTTTSQHHFQAKPLLHHAWQLQMSAWATTPSTAHTHFQLRCWGNLCKRPWGFGQSARRPPTHSHCHMSSQPHTDKHRRTPNYAWKEGNEVLVGVEQTHSAHISWYTQKWPRCIVYTWPLGKCLFSYMLYIVWMISGHFTWYLLPEPWCWQWELYSAIGFVVCLG